MAIVKVQIMPPGYADIVHPETEASMVLMADSSTVEANIAAHKADYVRQPGYSITTGGTLAYLLTLSPVPSALVDGMGISAKINATNTGAVTINPNSLGVIPVKNPDGTALIAGDLVAGGIYSFKYNSTTTNFILVGKGGGPNKAGSNTVFTPSTTDQAITKGFYPGALTDGKVLGDSNLIPANLVPGKTIFGVTGVQVLAVGDGVMFDNSTSSNTTSLSAVKIGKRYTAPGSGSIRIKITLASGAAGGIGYGRVYKNGVAIGTQRSATNPAQTQFVEDFTCNAGDYFDIYAYTNNASAGGYLQDEQICVVTIPVGILGTFA